MSMHIHMYIQICVFVYIFTYLMYFYLPFASALFINSCACFSKWAGARFWWVSSRLSQWGGGRWG